MVAPTQGRTVPPTDGKRKALMVDPIRLEPSKRADSPLRTRIMLAAMLGVLAIATAVVVLADLDGETAAQLFSPGCLSDKHSEAVHPIRGGEIRCSDCHVPGSPIRADAEGGATPPKSKWGRATDLKCRVCHPAIPPDTHNPNLTCIGPHSANEDPGKVGACATCHSEHNGAVAQLTNVAAQHCTECHADLKASAAPGVTLTVANEISGFEDKHPDWTTGPDRGQIKFSHKRHLAAGLILPGGDGQPGERKSMLMRWGELQEEEWELLTDTAPDSNAAIQLTCASCHKQSDDTPRDALTASYANSCAACHRLDFEANRPPIAHGLTASQIRLELIRAFKPTDGQPRSESPNPPREINRFFDLQWSSLRDFASAEERAKTAGLRLRRKCVQCHLFDLDDPPPDELPLPDVKPSNLETNWLGKSKFNHNAHLLKGMKCVDCHAAVDASDNHHTVLIPGKRTCMKCHSSESDASSDPRERGGSNCITCHQYHSPVLRPRTSVASRLSDTVATAVVPAQTRFIGPSSCARSGCHGGGDESTRSPSRRAYTIWETKDPHARAYDALFTQRAHRMVQALKPSSETDAQFRQRRCVTCHATAQSDATLVLDHDPMIESVLRDGVSCETCHGPAMDWYKAHTREGWQAPPSEFVSTQESDPRKRIMNRVHVCVKCHVGSLASDEQPWRDVNHDLIAAGHPRLEFNFVDYMANLGHYSRHWRSNNQPDYKNVPELENVVALAALRQLAHRASGQAPESIWPEFSEYDCKSCHHQLGKAKETVGDRPRVQLGRPHWSPWYLPDNLLELIGGQAKTLYTQLEHEMSKPLPDARAVAEICGKLIVVIEAKTNK